MKKELSDIFRSLLQLRFMANGRNFLSAIMKDGGTVAFGALDQSGNASGAARVTELEHTTC